MDERLTGPQQARGGVASDAAESIRLAHVESNIDGYGDEGEGYDYEFFAQELKARGWVYVGNGTKAQIVSLMTGLSLERLEELGGVPEDD